LRDLPGGVAPVGAMSEGRGPGSGDGSDGGRGNGRAGGDGDGVRAGFGYDQGGGFPSPGGDISWPRLVREVSPRYTAEAMRARIEGVVHLEAVVRSDGTVGRVRVRRSLDAAVGLDDEAVTAVRAWRFTPALRRGQPVDVVVPVEVAFTLR
jgi:protein TonB